MFFAETHDWLGTAPLLIWLWSSIGAAFALGCWYVRQRQAARRFEPSVPAPAAAAAPVLIASAVPIATGPAQAGCDQEFVEALADFSDEIVELRQRSSQQPAQLLDFAADKINALLELAGAELIRSEVWNPQVQRAIAVRTTVAGQRDNDIVACGASGLRIRGELVRKQEVIIVRAPR